jgi:thiol:disulfide interchange protein
MKFMFSLAFFALLIPFSAQSQAAAHATADTLVWYNDLGKARQISDAKHIPIFAFFTGSDWCGWCHKLQANVFAKPEFVSWAKKNVVLLELDFPRRKQLPPEIAQQNMALQQALKIAGYPTVWLMYVTPNEENKGLNLVTLGSLGYPQGAEAGKEELKFLSDADAILAKGKK